MPARDERRRLVMALALLAAFVVAEVVVALLSGSLALLSDAGHMVSDVGALAASVWASYLAARPAGGAWTFGFKRAEILSAAGNGITLLVVAGVIAVEAIRRLFHPPAVAGTPVLVVALVGIAVNVAATWILAGARHANLNAEGAFRHVITDLYGFVGTAVAAVLILTTGFQRADPIASLLVVVLMLHAAFGLLRDSGRILLEGAPGDVNLAEIRGHLTSIEHVHEVHDLHVWTVTSDLPALSAHVVVDDSCFHDGHVPRLLDQLQACLAGHFDVEHSTFQFEPIVHAEHEHDTHA
ncbi:MAG TPA: cation diffusion facilitator family transporter [Jatrophihabitans sp.]|nr:cation diffusion facilitator family transporter [Jatrophihabitans sp.]